MPKSGYWKSFFTFLMMARTAFLPRGTTSPGTLWKHYPSKSARLAG